MYSFKDVVGLKTIATLRHRLPLQELRRVGAWLHERYDAPWTELRFFVLGDAVVLEDGEGARRVAGTDQTVLTIALSDIEQETQSAARVLLERRPDQIGRIVRNRYVQHNSWVLDGTRIPTSAIWAFHEAGFKTSAIQREYPRLMDEDVEAAIAFESQRERMAG